MEIVVKFYSSNHETYKSYFKKIAEMAFEQDGISVDPSDIKYDLIYIPGKTIQAQRAPTTEHSRTMRIYVDGVIKYVIGLSNTNYDEDKKKEAARKGMEYVSYGKSDYHSNTYLNQGINKIFDCYLKEKINNQDVKLLFYLLDTQRSYSYNPSNLLTYRKLATIGFKVLNINELPKTEWKQFGLTYKEGMSIAYTSFNKFLNDISYVAGRNKQNIPAYIKCIEEEDETKIGDMTSCITKYIYTFKGLGAGAYDCFLTMWTLVRLAEREHKILEFLFAPEKYKFRLGQKHPSFTHDIPDTISQLFKQLGINITYETTDEVLQQLEREKNKYLKAKKKGDLRNQELFKNNLRIKGIQTKCYLCGCEVEAILEAAHLWGVSEIKNASDEKINDILSKKEMDGVVDNDSKYSKDMFYKRYMLANSGDNGVWLCNNHHGLFDGHYFCFDSATGKVIIDKLKPKEDVEYLQSQTPQMQLSSDVLSARTRCFLRYSLMK